MFSLRPNMKRSAAVFCCLVALFGVQLTRATSSPAGARSAQPVVVSGSSGVTTPSTVSPRPGATHQDLEQRLMELQSQITALKQQIALNETDPKLWERYETLFTEMREIYSQIHTNDTPEAQAPTVTACIAGLLSATSQSFVRPNPITTGSGIGSCPSASTVHYNVYQFNLTGCTTFPAQVTLSLCGGAIAGSGCATTSPVVDTIMFIYRSAALTTNGATINPFNPASPCTNLVAADDDLSGASIAAGGSSCDNANTADCHPVCTGFTGFSGMKRSLGSGFFSVVIASFGTTASSQGAYNLFASVTAAGCAINAPTAVKLELVSASSNEGGVTVDWKTGREVDNLGFNVYRDDAGKRTRLNKQMIAGSALLAGPGVSLNAGQSYSFGDILNGTADSRYWVEDIALDGTSTWHGPVTSDRASPRDPSLPPPAKGKVSMLSKLGTDDARQNQSAPLSRSAKPAQITAAALATQSTLAARPALKMAVKEEGWYRVSQPELVAAGLDSRTHPAMLQLFVDGKELPFRVTGDEDGQLDASDAIEFYGLGLDSAASNARTYWLVSGSQPGQRVSRVNGKGKREAPGSFPYTVERSDRTVYFSGLRNGEKENFFGAVIAREPVDQALDVQHLDRSSTEDAALEIELQGVTLLQHRVGVELNGTAVGELSFHAQSAGAATMKLPRGVLKEGSNTVRLTPLGGDTDVTLMNFIRITYPHTYAADGNALRFSTSKKQQISIDGFTSSSIRVIDVTDPDSVSELSAKVRAKNGGYSATVNSPKGGTRLLWAFTEDRVSRPASLAADRPSNLREPGQGADLVIISHRDFISSLQPLRSLRESQGYKVLVADAEDVFDEFNFGQKSPEAIRDFLAFAVSSWQTRPRFALLVGDASVDPKGYLGAGDSDFLPTKLIDTSLLETASDGWLGEIKVGGTAEIAVGRLPVRTAEEAASVVAKIVNYDRSEPSNNVLLVTDSNEDFDFESFTRQIRSEIPQDIIVGQLDRGRMDPVMAQSELLANIYRGQKVVNYVGHGSVNQWRADLLTSTDARELQNSAHLPLFVTMTCLNGYFQDPGLEGLAESLIKAERGGAIAVLASSGMTSPMDQSALNQQIFRLILNGGPMTLGEATLRAKAIVSNSDVRRTWMLFGDPTTRLR